MAKLTSRRFSKCRFTLPFFLLTLFSPSIRPQRWTQLHNYFGTFSLKCSDSIFRWNISLFFFTSNKLHHSFIFSLKRVLVRIAERFFCECLEFFHNASTLAKNKSDNLYQRVSAPVSLNKSPVQSHNLEPRVLRLFVNSWSPEEACTLISCYTDNQSKAYCLKSMYSPRVKPAPIRWPQSPWALVKRLTMTSLIVFLQKFSISS